MSSRSSGDVDAIAGLIGLLLAAAAAVALAIAALFVGAHLICGLVVNFCVRLLAALVYRIRRIPAGRLLGGVLASGVLVSPILFSASLYSHPWGFLAPVGLVIALVGYYGANWRFKMPFQSEAAMRAEEEIIRARVRIWALSVRHRFQVARLTLLSGLGFKMH